MASDLCVISKLDTEHVEPRARRRAGQKRRARLAHILQLPSEILMRIIDFASYDPTDVVLYSLVCRKFHEYTSNETLWQRVCINRFGYVHPTTISRSGSWKALMRTKSLIENSPWTIKPQEPVRELHNDLLGASSTTRDTAHPGILHSEV